MILKAYYNARAELSASVEINIDTGLYKATRRTPAGTWCDRYESRAKAEKRFQEFITLSESELESRIRCPQR